jgi:hypothetical protein
LAYLPGQKFIDRWNALSNGELYTILTQQSSKGKKGTIVAMIAGTKAQTVIRKNTAKTTKCFWDNTWHGSKHGIDCKKMFPNATRVTDRFHAKLALEALQEIRIK